MTTNTSEEELLAQQFLDALPIYGEWTRTITRHDGTVERKVIRNIVTKDGLNHLASRAVADTGSKYGWLGVGTADYTPHINSQSIGEASRKAAAIIGSSRELIVAAPRGDGRLGHVHLTQDGRRRQSPDGGDGSLPERRQRRGHSARQQRLPASRVQDSRRLAQYHELTS